MYKAPPVASRICQYKWEQHQNKKLAKRLKKVKASIDNKPPRAVPHLANKAKKEQEMELKYRKIEKANRLLLERMSRIMTTSTLDNKIAKRPRRQGVHAASRRAEAIRITRENQMLLKRIQSKKAFMSKKEWQRHHKEHKYRLGYMKATDPKKVVLGLSKKKASKKKHKLNPLDHGGFKAYGKDKSKKPMSRTENQKKAAENVIYKEGRLIDDQYVIVTVIENIRDRVFSFRTYALETSHQNRVDVPAMAVRNCVDDDSLLRADRHDELAMALIPRLRFVNEKLVFDTKSQNSEKREQQLLVAERSGSKLKGKRRQKDAKAEAETKKDIERLDKEANLKLEKQMAIANKGVVAKKKAEEKARRKAIADEEARKARAIREAEEREADEVMALEAKEREAAAAAAK